MWVIWNVAKRNDSMFISQRLLYIVSPGRREKRRKRSKRRGKQQHQQQQRMRMRMRTGGWRKRSATVPSLYHHCHYHCSTITVSSLCRHHREETQEREWDDAPAHAGMTFRQGSVLVLAWGLLCTIFSVPSFLYAMSASLPPENTLGIYGTALTATHQSAAASSAR